MEQPRAGDFSRVNCVTALRISDSLYNTIRWQREIVRSFPAISSGQTCDTGIVSTYQTMTLLSIASSFRLAKQVRLVVAASENCARKAASHNQEHLVAKRAKKRTVRPYTKTEEKELRAHSKAKTPVAKISKLTKRSVAALRKKAGEMGFPLGHRR
jgi:hypothetical protein